MKTWIKLYTEILSDPKMGRMSDKLFRRTIELFLLAGKEDAGGTLPGVDDIAWTLHISQKEVRSILKDLSDLNIISKESENYRISHFTDRQNSDCSRSEINHRYYEKSKQSKSENKTEIQTKIQTEVRPNSDLKKSEIQTLEEEVEVEVEKDINTLSDDRVLKTRAPKTAAAPKHKCGSFGNVLLTDAELGKLRDRFPDADARIEAFSVKKAAKGYTYKSDYAAILSWAEKDAKETTTAKVTNAPKRESWTEIANRIAAQQAQLVEVAQ